MKFNKHFELKGKHAVLSPSSYHWIGYDDEKLEQVYLNQLAAQRGTELHELAASMIKHGVKASRSKDTLSMYVNDAINFNMGVEQLLVYSPKCFGTADAISFRKKKLRIHDLKTGVTPASMKQLECYAALFCLEYHVNPEEIEIELRIYQSGEIITHNPEPEDIRFVMDTIVRSCNLIDRIDFELESEE